MQEILQKFPEVFKEGLREINTFQASLKRASPTFKKECPVPFALKEVIEREIDRLEEVGIIQKSHTVNGQPR